MLMGAGIASLALAGFLYIRGRKSAGAGQQQTEQLLHQIADLDDAYEAGRIDEKQYHKQRRQLKAELSRLMDDDA